MCVCSRSKGGVQKGRCEPSVVGWPMGGGALALNGTEWPLCAGSAPLTNSNLENYSTALNLGSLICKTMVTVKG